jgi:hypothetical protein
MHKTSIDFLGKNPDAIGAKSFVPLSHKLIAGILIKGFEIVTRDTHFITCRARQILVQNVHGDIYQEEELFKAETAMNTMFEQVHEYFDARITQGEQKLEMAGFNLNDVQRLVTNYEAETYTNGVTQYLDILAKADHYMTILQYLWVTGELSDSPDEAMRVKLLAEREIRVTLFGITRASSVHFNNVRRLCEGIVEARRQERAKQSERDRRRTPKKTKKVEQLSPKQQEAADRRREEMRLKREAKKQLNMATTQADMNQLATEAIPA